MIKLLAILFLGIPYVLYSQCWMLHFLAHKGKYSLEFKYNRLRKTVMWVCKLLRIKINANNKEVLEKLQGGAIIASNHLSVVDILAIICLSPQPLIFISKIENKKVPFLNAHLKAIDCLTIDRKDLKQSLRVSKDAGLLVKDGHNVVIFAEGTRSKDGNVAPFKAAFPTIVHYSQNKTVLITIYNSKAALKFRFFAYPKNIISINIFDPLPYEFYLSHKKEFNEITHKMVSDKLEEFKNEYNRNNRKES